MTNKTAKNLVYIINIEYNKHEYIGGIKEVHHEQKIY